MHVTVMPSAHLLTTPAQVANLQVMALLFLQVREQAAPG